MAQKAIIYEQPLNEHIRICLRLEYLFKQMQYYLEQTSRRDMHHALVTIIDILDVLDRPDLKSKLTNALRSYSAILARLQQLSAVDKPRLRTILSQLDQFIDLLHHIHGKLGQSLRDNEFLTAIRQRLAVPGGTCDFDVPSYHLWLQQPIEQQRKNIFAWFNTFTSLQDMVNLLLHLTRDSVVSQAKRAANGFHQEALATDISYQMIRVAIPSALNIYPDISIGRHRLSIHFFKLNVAGRPIQIKDDVEFELTCCRI